MCTNPVQRSITYKGNFSRRTIVVPCGKCAECRAKLQSEFAALSCLEAESAGSIGFLTLTYNNDSLPLSESAVYLHTDVDSGESFEEVVHLGFSRGFSLSREEVCGPFIYGLGENSTEFFLCPSLCRVDVQKCIKRYREDYVRRHNGERCDFRFTFFGEYGERYHRPHYHMLIYGLDSIELDYFCKQWHYGFIDCKFITHFNSDGSDAFSMVSRYVSKYVGKKDALPKFVLDGYAEKPRKQSSIAFGRRNLDEDALRNFI